MTMNRRDLFVGAKVYHALLWNWGQGEVVEVRDKDNLGYSTFKRYRVHFPSSSIQHVWLAARSLRKTPQRRRTAKGLPAS